MTSKQSAKYKKFIIGAASAALVASAVAPVASAKDFSDTKGNTHEPAIDALSDAGVITGYPDGSFLPNKTLTRSDVVKLMGKWLVSEGYKVPTDYKTNMRFKDLTPKSNDELLQYAAVVKENGVFNGSNGNLLAGDNITRENMAVVIVRAFDQVKDMDLVAFVKEQEFKKDVTDLAKAKAEARTAIDVLDFFDITNPAAPAFNPKNTTTRGQFATFLHKSMNTDFSAVTVDADLVAAAAQVKDGAVTVSRGEYATDANKLAAVQAHVKGLVTNKDVVATVAAGKTAGNYVATLTKGEAKVEKTIAVTFEFAADDRFVADVKAINAVQLEVKFSTAVDSASIFNTNGSLKAGVITLTSLDNVDAGTLTAELSENGRTLTVTSATKLEKRYDVKTDLVIAVDKKVIPTNNTVVTVNDTVRPTFAGVSYESNSNATFSFSEPIEATTAQIAAALTVNGPTTVNVVVGDITLSSDKKSFTVKLPTTMTKDQNYTFTFTGLKDFAGNLVTPNPISTTVVRQDADSVKPTVTAVATAGIGKVQVTFSEKVNVSAAALKVDGNAATTPNFKLDAGKTVMTVSSTSLTAGVRSLEISGVKDLAGNEMDVTTKVVEVTADTTAPTFVSQSVKTVAGVQYLVVNYSEDVTVDNTKSITGTVKGSDSVTTTVSSITGEDNLTTGEDGKSIEIKLPKTTGDYTLNLPTGLAVDKASLPAVAKTVTFNLGAAVDTVQPKVSTVVQTNDKVVVTFDRAVTSATALNIANYEIEGVSSPFEGTPIFKGNAKTVELTLKNDVIATTGDRNFTVQNVATDAGAVMVTDVTSRTFVETVRPTATSAKVIDETTIEITFSEALKDGEAGNDFEVFQGASTTALAEASEVISGKKVTIKLAKKLTSLTGITVKAQNTIDLKDANNNVINFSSINVQ